MAENGIKLNARDFITFLQENVRKMQKIFLAFMIGIYFFIENLTDCRKVAMLGYEIACF